MLTYTFMMRKRVKIAVSAEAVMSFHTRAGSTLPFIRLAAENGGEV
jgi:hypothetical protein